MTPAAWIRRFVTSHAKYQHDSVVSDEICHDLVQACADIADGKLAVPELLGNHYLPVSVPSVEALPMHGGATAVEPTLAAAAAVSSS